MSSKVMEMGTLKCYPTNLQGGDKPLGILRPGA